MPEQNHNNPKASPLDQILDPLDALQKDHTETKPADEDQNPWFNTANSRQKKMEH